MGFILKENNDINYIHCKLTEEGRRKIAEGNFNPSYYSLGDSEVDYIYYNDTNRLFEDSFVLKPIDKYSKIKYKITNLSGSTDTNFDFNSLSSNEVTYIRNTEGSGFFSGTTYNHKAYTTSDYTIQGQIRINISQLNSENNRILNITKSIEYGPNTTEPSIGDYLLVNWKNPFMDVDNFNLGVINSTVITPYLWYKIIDKNGLLADNTLEVTLDRDLPNYGTGTTNTFSYGIIYPKLNSMQGFYDSVNPSDYWRSDVINFDKNCNDITNGSTSINNNIFVSFEDVFNTWKRFSHSGSVIPANLTELESWSYDPVLDKISSTVNSATYLGIVSNQKLSNYRHRATLGSASTDNDVISLIIAYTEDENDLTLNNAFNTNTPYVNTTDEFIPRQHTLSLIRLRSNQFIDDLRYAIVYNYTQSDEKIIVTGGNLPWLTNQDWLSNSVDVEVLRIENDITVRTSNFSDAPGGKGELGFPLSFNLNDFPETIKFIGPKSYGYGAYSQIGASFTNVELTTTEIVEIESNIWNLNILFTEDIAGIRKNNKQLKDQYSTRYAGFLTYLTSEDFNHKNIGIIHYSNNNPSNKYGDRFVDDVFIDLPTILWHKNQDNNLGVSFKSDNILKTFTEENFELKYFHLIDDWDNIVGRVFPDLKIITITDQELLYAMSYKSNRNWTLVEPKAQFVDSGCPVDIGNIGTYYYGKYEVLGGNVTIPTENEINILSGIGVNNVNLNDFALTIPFNSGVNDFIWFAIPSVFPLRTEWFVNILNRGNIGGAKNISGNLFPDPVLVTYNNIEYRLYISNYRTNVEFIDILI